MRAARIAATAALGVLLAAWCSPAAAQTQPRRQAPAPAAPRGTSGSDQGVRARVFGEAGARRFTAAQTFEAVLGSSIGPLFGGGVEVLWGRHLSVEGSVVRYRGTGERVFVSDGEVFPLNIPTTVTLLPIAATVSYRFPQGSVIPFVGAGVNFHRYTETSEFAADGEDVSSTFTGFHVLGGAEWRLTTHVGLAGVGRWASVRDAIGTEPTSAATAFGEHDLGGFDAAVRIIIGRR
jgi:opacity protein-like surface antigen